MPTSHPVYVPVEAPLVSDDLAYISRLKSGKAVVRADNDRSDLDKASFIRMLLERMYQESYVNHQRLLESLADHPDEWRSTHEIATALGLTHGIRSLAGSLGALGLRSAHRYGGQMPWESRLDDKGEECYYRMTSEVATQIKAIAAAAAEDMHAGRGW